MAYAQKKEGEPLWGGLSSSLFVSRQARMASLCRHVYPAVAVHFQHIVAVVVELFACCNLLNHLFHVCYPFFLFRYTILYVTVLVGCRFTSVILNFVVYGAKIMPFCLCAYTTDGGFACNPMDF